MEILPVFVPNRGLTPLEKSQSINRAIVLFSDPLIQGSSDPSI